MTKKTTSSLSPGCALPPDVATLLAAASPANVGLPKGCARPCRVVHVVDGDTVRVVYAHADGKGASHAVVRLAHVQAPEMHGEDRACGVVARRRLAELVTDCGAQLPGETVADFSARVAASNTLLLRLVVVVERDKYGRVVGELWTINAAKNSGDADISINENMLRGSYAGAYGGSGPMPDTKSFFKPTKA